MTVINLGNTDNSFSREVEKSMYNICMQLRVGKGYAIKILFAIIYKYIDIKFWIAAERYG